VLTAFAEKTAMKTLLLGSTRITAGNDRTCQRKAEKTALTRKLRPY
jgi:hypothetical protein